MLDDRQVARPTMAHVEFFKERFSTGDMKGIAVPDAMKLIMREWKELGEADKQVSHNKFAQILSQLWTSADLGHHAEILQLTGSVPNPI